ncbi:MAG: PHP domain-containing protein [Candidatus Sericytochromatia bacterium]|nr:PHP domain-containing protein [Candidatus Sericytochromatia bacterium]
MTKDTVIEALEEMATLLELAGENPFKVRAFQRGAQVLGSLTEPLAEAVERGTLKALPGIGKGLFEDIAVLVRTGQLPALEALRAATPEGVREMLEVPGLGTKKVRALRDGLGIGSVGELEYAIGENRLLTLSGFGPATQAKLGAAIAMWKRNRGLRLLADVLPAATRLVDALSEQLPQAKVALVGNLRRRCETVAEVRLLVAGTTAAEFRGALRASALVEAGEAGETLVGLPIRLEESAPEAWGARLVWTTGSPEWLGALSERATSRGLSLDAAGLRRGGQPVEIPTEEALFEALGLPRQAPERWETAAMLAGPDADALVKEGDLQGAFHVHTSATDGTATLREMVLRARELGWRYIGISDHSEAAFYARGLDRDRIRAQQAEIAALNAEFDDITVLSGIEADILADGRLDYDDETLASFDFVIGSVHSRFGQDAEAMTKRLITALSHPRLTMLGHLSGRLLLAREPYGFDLEAVFAAAVAHGKAMELNANPHRLDLDWRHLARARELGIPIAINPDAHSLDGLEDLQWGVAMARKGGLTAADVLNTVPAAALRSKMGR